MGAKDEHGTLVDRLAQTRANEAARGHGTQGFHGTPPADWADSLRERPATPPAIKHCWYDGPYGRQAALLLEWRGGDGLFHGRIAVATHEPDGWAITEMWVEQGLLAPVG